MKMIGLTMRVDEASDYAEKRDCIDQRWLTLIARCGYTPVLLPNNTASVATLLKQVTVDGIILTGGNTPVSLGGNAPERDELDQFLISHCVARHIPLLGVCRGMQSVLMYYKCPLIEVSGHVSHSMQISYKGQPRTVNSYHHYGCYTVSDELSVTGISRDGVVKSIVHVSHALTAYMWHPERVDDLSSSLQDIKEVFQ